MTEFSVDPGIAGLTHVLCDWHLSRVLLVNESRYHWGLLVPRRVGLMEIYDLTSGDQEQLINEITRLSKIIRSLPGVEKINVAALGNITAQLHVHVVGRFKGDPAWPGPVFGHSPPQPWSSREDAPLTHAIQLEVVASSDGAKYC